MKLKHKRFALSLVFCLAAGLSLFQVFMRLRSSHPYFLPLISSIIFLWVGVIVLFALVQSARERQTHNSREHDEVLKQIRFLNQEIEFYEKRRQELSFRATQRNQLSSAARELGSLLDPAKIQDKLFQTAQHLFPGRFVQITAGQDPDGVDQWVMERRQLLNVPNGVFKGPPLLAVPIYSQGLPVGVIRVGGEASGAAFGRDDGRLLEILAGFASSALDNTTLFARVQENALRDNLTGLWSHKVFQDQLESEILEASRFRKKISIILADVDHFKMINDTHGHQAGDQVLKNFSAVLTHQVRDIDFVARYGGEEFVILLLETDAQEAFKVAENIRHTIENSKVAGGTRLIAVTSSFGVATFPDDATSAQQLIRKADERLYQAKHAGRNRVMGRSA